MFWIVTLPLMATFIATIWIASWSQNKRIEEISKRIDSLERNFERRLEAIEASLKSIEAKLSNFAERIVKLEVAKWQ